MNHLHIGLCAALFTSACVFEEPDPASFVTENVLVTTEYGGQTFRTESASVEVIGLSGLLHRGVMFRLEGAGARGTVASELDVDGNMEALCPGSQVTLERFAGELVTVSAAGPMENDLMELRATMQTQVALDVAALDTEPDQLVMRADPLADSGRVHVNLATRFAQEGQQGTVNVQFDMARLEQDEEVGWD